MSHGTEGIPTSPNFINIQKFDERDKRKNCLDRKFCQLNIDVYCYGEYELYQIEHVLVCSVTGEHKYNESGKVTTKIKH